MIGQRMIGKNAPWWRLPALLFLAGVLLFLVGLSRGFGVPVTGLSTVADNAAILQTAINQCAAGDTLQFPAGSYPVGHTLTLKSGCNYQGTGTTLAGTGGYPLFQTTDPAGGNMTISGLTFSGGGIYFTDSGGTMSNVRITGCTFRDFLTTSTAFGPFQDGIFSGGHVLLSNSSIDHNTFTNFGTSNELTTTFNDSWKAGILVYAPSNLTIDSNTFDLIAGNGIALPAGINGPHPNLKITNNTFTRIHRIPIEVQTWNLTNPLVSGNRISAPFWPYSFGISFAAGGGLGDPTTATGASITGNVIDFSTPAAGSMSQWAACIELQGIRALVDSNICLNGGGSGAFGGGVVIAGPDAIISNNTFCGHYTYGVTSYEPPYPDQQGHPATITNNSNPAACTVPSAVPPTPAPAPAPTVTKLKPLVLDPAVWTLVNPLNDGAVTTSVALTVPAGSNHDPQFGGMDNAIRAMQPIANTDFSVEARFDSIPTLQYQFEGLIIEQDPQHYLRFQFGSTGSALIANEGTSAGSAQTDGPSATITAPGKSLWMRITRSGNSWSMLWSGDGVTFAPVGGSFTAALTVARLGPFAGNYSAQSAPAFTALVGYVR